MPESDAGHLDFQNHSRFLGTYRKRRKPVIAGQCHEFAYGMETGLFPIEFDSVS